MQNKIHGEYLTPTYASLKNEIDNYDEAITFFVLSYTLALNGMLQVNDSGSGLSIDTKSAHETFLEGDGEELADLYLVEYLINHTQKFGVVLDKKPTEKEFVDFNNQSFLKWYNFWNRHFEELHNNGLTSALYECFEKGNDYSAFLPKTRWNDSSEKSQNKDNNNSSNSAPQGPQ